MKRIRMLTSLAGDAFAWSPDQVLVVGEDITEEMAGKLVAEPADAPRAEWLEDDEVVVNAETDPAESSEPVVFPWGSQEYFDRFDETEEEQLVEEIGEWGTEVDGAGVLLPPQAFIEELVDHEQAHGERQAVVDALTAHLAEPAVVEEPPAGVDEGEGLGEAPGDAGEPGNAGSGEPESTEEVTTEVKDDDEKTKTQEPETADAPVAQTRETADVKHKRTTPRKRPPKKPADK